MDLQGAIDLNAKQYTDLANHHLATDLTQSDRDALSKGARKIQIYTYAGAAVGTALGLLVSARGRMRMLEALKAVRDAPKPAEMIMKDGSHIKVPEAPIAAQPGPLTGLFGTMMITFLGLFSGTQLGLVAGTFAAQSAAKQADQTRLMNAYRAFRIDLLKQELRNLEQGDGNGLPRGPDGEELKGFWH